MPTEQADRIAVLEEEVADLTKALTGLTCGGSEFFIRRGERFVADIPACVEWVRRSKQDAHRRTVDAALATREAKAALTALQARVGELEGALKELASEDFAGPPGVSIYAAAANELPRRIKLAQAALLTPPWSKSNGRGSEAD